MAWGMNLSSLTTDALDKMKKLKAAWSLAGRHDNAAARKASSSGAAAVDFLSGDITALDGAGGESKPALTRWISAIRVLFQMSVLNRTVLKSRDCYGHRISVLPMYSESIVIGHAYRKEYKHLTRMGRVIGERVKGVPFDVNFVSHVSTFSLVMS